MSLSEKIGQGPRVEVQGLFHSNSVPQITFLIPFEYSLLKRIGLFQVDFHHSFWSICIRIPCRIWADLCKIFYLPLSTEMRSICIHVMNDFGFLWCLCRACIFESRVTFLADSPILNCADNISNQNGFGKAHLLLFNVQWDLVWDLWVLSQDRALKSAQIGKNGVQFPANSYVSDSLNKRTPAFGRMLACHP